MKKCILFFSSYIHAAIFLRIHSYMMSMAISWGGTHIQTVPGKTVTLTDSLTSTHFILDSAHIFIYAICSGGDTLWKTDPWKDNNLEAYRVKRPVIVQFRYRTL
jgi:hypothetical protein